jgi:hypothetical protein
MKWSFKTDLKKNYGLKTNLSLEFSPLVRGKRNIINYNI